MVGPSSRFDRMTENRNYFIMNDISNNIVEPFKRDDDLLSESSLCIFPSLEEPSQSGYRTISSEQDWALFDPKLSVLIANDSIKEKTGFSPSECGLSIIIRDRDYKRFIHAGEFSPSDDSLDEIRLLDDFNQLSRSCNFEISIYLHPINDAQNKQGFAKSRFDILSSKDFKIAPAELERQIPIVWVDDETMEKKVGARDCIWRIEWLESDKLDDELEEKDQFSFYLDNEIEDVLEIWFNEKFRIFFKKNEKVGLRSSLHKKQISAEIYSEIFRKVCESNEEPSNPRGLLALVESLSIRRMMMNLEELRFNYKAYDPEAFLRSIGNRIVDIDLDLLGIRKRK